MAVPLASVIIPCFNCERYVGDAISSALKQSWSAVEVIIVDDGSTDQSLNVIRSFGDKIRWESIPNSGACAARNLGLRLAQGEYIQFLDADDLLHPLKIEKCVACLTKSPLPNLAYTLHDVKSLDEDALPATQWNRRSGNDDAINFMLRGDLPTPAPLHHRSVLTEVGGFDECMSCAQDREFHLRLAIAGVRFQLIPEELFTIRRRSGSISTTMSREIERQRARLAILACDTLKSAGNLTEHRRAECAGMIMRASRRLYQHGDLATARHLANRAFDVHPSGGLELAYSRPTRVLRALVGPRMAESLVTFKRRIVSSP
jgi:glycosyltransferase involved in cell wall biosynthesis